MQVATKHNSIVIRFRYRVFLTFTVQHPTSNMIPKAYLASILGSISCFIFYEDILYTAINDCINYYHKDESLYESAIIILLSDKVGLKVWEEMSFIIIESLFIKTIRTNNQNIANMVFNISTCEVKEAVLKQALSNMPFNTPIALYIIEKGVKIGIDDDHFDMIQHCGKREIIAVYNRFYDQFDAIIQYLPACIGKDLTYEIFSLPEMHAIFDISLHIKKLGLVFKWV